MKKSKYLNIISLASIAGVLAPTIVLSSCSSSHFDNLSTDKKERTSEEGEFTCTFSLDLKEALKDGQSINVEITQTSASENTSIELNEQAVTEGKTVTFETVLQLTSNTDLPSFYAKFDAKIKCLDSNQATVWEENIKDFKHTVKCEKHSTSATSKVDNVELEVDKTFITEHDFITLKFNNKRTTKVVDANLTIKINDQHVNTSIELADNAIPVGQSEVTFTKAKLQELFTEYTIQPTDTIEFILVRSGAYKVVDNQLYVFDDFNDSSLVAKESLPTGGKFLVKSPSSDDFVFSDKIVLTSSKTTLASFIAETPALADGEKYDIYLINGEYFSATFERTLAKTQFDVHGLVYGETKTASIRVYKTVNEGLQWDFGIQVSDKIAFNFENLIINGSYEGKRNAREEVYPYCESDISRGFMCNDLQSFKDCDFKGAYAQWYSKTKYTHCTFDSRKVWRIDNEGLESEEVCNLYPAWINTTAQAYFDDCDFYSGGKCIKIDLGNTATVNVVNNCRFYLNQSTIKSEAKKPEVVEEVEIKYVIEIGTDYQADKQAHIWYQDMKYVETQGFKGYYHRAGNYPNNAVVHENALPTDPW